MVGMLLATMPGLVGMVGMLLDSGTPGPGCLGLGEKAHPGLGCLGLGEGVQVGLAVGVGLNPSLGLEEVVLAGDRKQLAERVMTSPPVKNSRFESVGDGFPRAPRGRTPGGATRPSRADLKPSPIGHPTSGLGLA